MLTTAGFDVDTNNEDPKNPYVVISLAGIELYRSYWPCNLKVPEHQIKMTALAEFAGWLAEAIRQAEYGAAMLSAG